MAKTYLGSEHILIKRYADEEGKEEIVCNASQKQKDLMKKVVV